MNMLMLVVTSAGDLALKEEVARLRCKYVFAMLDSDASPINSGLEDIVRVTKLCHTAEISIQNLFRFLRGLADDLIRSVLEPLLHDSEHVAALQDAVRMRDASLGVHLDYEDFSFTPERTPVRFLHVFKSSISGWHFCASV